MNPTIYYVSTAADDRNATRLTISPEGRASLVVGSNRDVRTNSIGRFEGPLPSDLWRRLIAVVSAPTFNATVSQPSLVPDESYRRIQLAWANGSEVQKLIGEQIATPPGFAEAESVLREVMQALMRSPVAALALALAPLPEQVASGAPTAIELVLANPGPLAFRIPAPPLWGRQASNCEVAAVRSDIPAAKRGLRDQHFLSLGAESFATAAPPLDGSTILLAPGERTRLRFQPVIPWSPGQYRLEVTLAVTAIGPDDQPLFAGALVSAPDTLSVVAP